ncbi:DedA family protein [Billgrantia diversa]|uniref:YqaA family protein n=1 Tax=Halomonas sp. MCCC 1A13316 TaxID=2733487 RepID=UPI0018A63F6E|nr:VTT domain-containing protein [Halomonas sp. MCCC 1A13316]QOR38071.1 DedA family protein [Halomonas sp. MCCC 1A13316]
MARLHPTSARDWFERLNRSPHALWLLFGASMLETLLVPIPIEVILIPWMLCHPERKWIIAGVALAGNLLAASLGYLLGVFAMEQWGNQLIGIFGSQEVFEGYRSRLQEEGFMAIVTIGIVPVPFQIAMLAAGASGYPYPLFLLAAMLGRGVRYFGLALLVALAGDAALKLWERHARKVGLVLLALCGTWVWYEVTT